MGLLGINCAIIPHFNNAEGKDYDTSCCYLGLERLKKLEQQLPAGTVVIGIDEHTGLTYDLEKQIFSKTGKWNINTITHGDVTLLELNTDIFKNINNETTKSSSIKFTNTEELIPELPLDLAKIVESGDKRSAEALMQLVNLASSNQSDIISVQIEQLLRIRSELKAEKKYDLADQIRDVVISLNVKVQDSLDGYKWTKNESTK